MFFKPAGYQQLKSGNQKTKKDMLRSIGKQSGESVESVLKKSRKAMVSRMLQKRKVLSSTKE